MSRRLNMYGFSLGQMRRLIRSQDRQAVHRIRDRLAAEHPYWGADEHRQVGEIVERAILAGVPFPDLREETHLHSLAAGALASDQQEWLVTDASVYRASALEDEMWRRCRKVARPEIRAFLRGLIEGIPLFGQAPSSDGTSYAAIGLEKLRYFQGGLADLSRQLTYRVGLRKSLSDEDRDAAEFMTEFCGWVGQVADAERDLWFTFG